MQHLRIDQDVLLLQDRPAGHVALQETGQGVDDRHGGEGIGCHQAVVEEVLRVLGEAIQVVSGVLAPLRMADGPAHAVDVFRGGGEVDDLAVQAFRQPVHLGQRQARRDTVADHREVDHRIRPEEEQGGVQHRDLDVLAACPPLPGEQGGCDRLCHGERRALVGDDVADQVGERDVGVDLVGHHPREPLDHRVQDRPVGIRAGRSEPADRHVDDLRVDRKQVVEAQPQALAYTGPEVLDEDVGPCHEVQDHLATLRLAQVHGQGALAAVVVQEEGGEPSTGKRGPSQDVLAVDGFHLQDLGALVGQQEGGHGPADDLGEVHDAVTVERTRHGSPSCGWSGEWMKGRA